MSRKSSESIGRNVEEKERRVFSGVGRQEKALKRDNVESTSMITADDVYVPPAVDDRNSGERDIISTPPTPNVSSEIDFGNTSVSVIPENDGDDEDWVDLLTTTKE